MTFDMQKAHEVVANCKSHDDSIDHNYWNAHAGMVLPAALDEIDRLLDREQQLLLDVDRNYREKKEYAETINRQAKRIAELEAITGVEITDHNLSLIRSILHGEPHTREQRIRAFNLSGKVFRRMQKQRAALKKLSQAKRARGKALVEERAYAIEYNPNRTIEWTHEQAKERAREQLHREGKL